MMFAKLYKKYVRGTPKKAIVQLVQIFICHFTAAVVKGVDASCNKVYLNTRVIKHIYDKRTAEEFDFWIANLHDDQPPMCEVVTFFRTDENYLKSYELLWEWKGGTPSS